VPQVQPPSLPGQVDLKVTHEYQKWNNCGPVSLAVVTSYLGIPRDQLQVAAEVKGGEFDKNVGPKEMQAYLESVGLRAIVRVNGTPDELMRLVAASIPVIVHQWLLKPDNELVGHYRVVQGYDRRAGAFITSDPYTPPHKLYSFADFERFWQPWNHRYIVAFRPEQEAQVREALGADFDPEQNLARSTQATMEGIATNPNDAYAYFSLGDDRLAAGDAPGAVVAYDKAFALGMLPHFSWYNFGPYDALYRTGSFQRILDLSAPILKEANNVEELHFWTGKAWLALGQKDKAVAAFTLAVQLNAHYSEPKEMLASIQ
jgi:tetratricopeptide (TPR) repeat protein